MDNNNESTPATSGSQTLTVPVGAGWGPMGGYYNMYPWQQMMPGMAAGGTMAADADDAAGRRMQPSMQMMPGWGVGMQMMPGWQAGVQPVMQGTPGETMSIAPVLIF